MLLPLIFVAMLVYVAWITVQGFRTGTMEAISKGLYLTAEQKTQPIGFWAASIWNLALVALCLWGAIGSAMHR